MSSPRGKPDSALLDPPTQTLSRAALEARRAQSVGALLDALRAASHTFYTDRWVRPVSELAALRMTTGADLAGEVMAHPPFGRLQMRPEQPIRTGLALAAVPRPVPMGWTRGDLDAEAVWGARAFRRAGVRARSRTSDCLEGGLVTPGTLAISDALDHLDALALPVGPITTDAALARAREVWAIVRPEFLIADTATFAFLDREPRPPDCVVVLLLTPADLELLRQPPRADLYRILSLPQVSTFVAGECATHQGYHVAEDAVAVEVVDPASGEPLRDGEPGALLLTTLQRSAAVLRFDTGLRAALTRAPCACGETHARLMIG